MLGIFLRSFSLTHELFEGDEWHSLHNAFYHGYNEILKYFIVGSVSVSIPDSLFYKLCLESIGLSDTMVRLPCLIAGILIVLVIPLLIRPILGKSIANGCAFFLALSPILTFYSRFARPYSMAVLLGYCAVHVFYRWWISDEVHRFDRFLYGYGIMSAIATWYLPIMAPFVYGPFVYVALLIIFSRDRKQLIIKNMARIGLPAFLLFLIIDWYPFFHSYKALKSLASHDNAVIGLASLSGAFKILMINNNEYFLIAFLILQIIGLLKVLRSCNNYMIFMLIVSVIQIMYIIISKPLAGNVPHIFSRYILIILPTIYMLIMVGAKSIAASIHKHASSYTIYGVVAILIGLLFIETPYVRIMGSLPNNSINMSLLSYMILGKNFEVKRLNFMKRIPGFYDVLGGYSPGSMTIVETPYHYNGTYLPFYQSIHHQNILIGFINGLCSGNREGEIPYWLKNIYFRNYLFLKDIETLDQKYIDYVIFHKNPEKEVLWKPEFSSIDITCCIDYYQGYFGNPIYADNELLVFSIKKN